MKKIFIFLLILFIGNSLYAEKWHWENDGKWKDKFLALAAAERRNNNLESEMKVFKTISEIEQRMKSAEYEPFTETNQVESYRNTVFYSDENRSMTFVSASIEDINGEATLVFSFVLGWKIKTFTAKQAFEQISIDGHPFGQERTKKEFE